MRLRSLFQVCLFLIAIALSPVYAIAVPLDFDADGISDFTSISITDSDLVWSRTRSSDSTSENFSLIGSEGDHIIIADWLGLGAPQAGVVSADDESGALTWQVESDLRVLSADFGQAGDTVLSGGDFNHDGKADAALVRTVGRKLHWLVNLDLFAEGGTTALEFDFGRKTEQAFYVDPDGSGDWIATLRRVSRSSFIIRMLNVVSGETRRIKARGAFIASKSFPRPEPVKKSDGTDSLVIYREVEGVTVTALFDLQSQALSAGVINLTGQAVIGDFNSEPGEELAIVAGESTVIFNPFSGQSSEAVGVSGVPLDEINVNSFESSGEGSTPVGDIPAEGSLAGVCATYSAISVGELLIKSEISKHITTGDPRATGYTLVCAAQCPKNLRRADFFYADGSYAGSVGYYGRFSGNGRPRLYGAASDAPQHFARQIASQAQAIGNGKLYMQMSAARIGAETICKEFNPTGRNGGL